MDPITLAVGGGLLAVGYLAGLLSRRRRAPEPPGAVCGCTHSMALHDAEMGKCHGEVERPKVYNKQGDYIGRQYVPCSCRQYVGPRPVEEILNQRFLPPAQ